MNQEPLRIAVSGLHRGDNPQPGASIIRSIRRSYPNAFIVGLVYDALESGIYVEGGPDVVYTMPYPSAGADLYLQRLEEIHALSPFDYFLPTLDAEIELLVYVEDRLTKNGWKTFLPEMESLHRRAKNHLESLVKACELKVPLTEAVYDTATAVQAAREFGYPVMVKGQYYDAKKVFNDHELIAAMNKLLAEWGAPAIIQECISGGEFNAMGIGDGLGGIIGLCCIRKTIISEKGKGSGAITIHDSALQAMCEKLIAALKWRGPFEVEVMLDEADQKYSLIEINPRFPAWVDFPAQFGVNFASALIRIMIDDNISIKLPPCPAGHFYVRHQIEVLGHIHQLAELATSADFSSNKKQLI